jgi:hypothetical protein
MLLADLHNGIPGACADVVSASCRMERLYASEVGCRIPILRQHDFGCRPDFVARSI